MVIMNLEQLGEGEMTKTYVCEICHKTIFRAHGSVLKRLHINLKWKFPDLDYRPPVCFHWKKIFLSSRLTILVATLLKSLNSGTVSTNKNPDFVRRR